MTSRHCRKCRRDVELHAEFCPFCATHNPHDHLAGRLLFERFELAEHLSSDSTGLFYTALDTHNALPVTIKVLNLSDDDLTADFLNNAETLCALTHPNLTSIIDFGTEGNLAFIIFEVVTGSSLSQLLRDLAPLPANRALQLTLQLLDAVDVVHSSLAFAGDIGPDRILIEEFTGSEDFIKLLDLGCSRLISSANLPDTPSIPPGIPEYMAPEQAMNLDLDSRCDLYAIGAILYHMLTGHPPHRHNPNLDHLGLLVARISEDPPPPDRLHPQLKIPGALSDICMNALQRNRDDRFSSAREFRDELRPLLSKLSVDFSHQQSSNTLAWAVNQSLQTGIFSDTLSQLNAQDDHAEHPPRGAHSGGFPAVTRAVNEGLSLSPGQYSTSSPNNSVSPATAATQDAQEQDLVHDHFHFDDDLLTEKNQPSHLPLLPFPDSDDFSMHSLHSEHNTQYDSSHDDISTFAAEVIGFLAIRLSYLSSSDNTKTSLQSIIWSYLTELIQDDLLGFSALETNLGIFACSRDIIRVTELALKIRLLASTRFPFVRFGIGISYGFSPSNDDDIPLISPDTPAVQSACKIIENTDGNQVLIDEHLDPMVSDHFFTISNGLGHRIIIDHLSRDRANISPAGVSDLASIQQNLFCRLAERERIETLFKRIQARKSGAPLLITGVEGAGKSRLIAYIRTLAHLQGFPCFETFAHNRLLDRPFRPLLNLIEQAAGHVNASPEDLLTGLQLAGLDHNSIDALVKQFVCGTTYDDNPITQLDPKAPLDYLHLAGALQQSPPAERRFVLVNAIIQLLRRLTDSGGAVILIEDIHQADASSIKALPTLCALSRDCPLILVCSSVTHNIPNLEHFEHLSLQPLNDDDLQHFWMDLQDLKQTHNAHTPLPPAKPIAIDEIALERSGGIPLYLSLWAEMPVDAVPPSSIEPLISQYVALLEPELQRTLKICSTLGDYFDLDEIELLVPQNTLAKNLSRAQHLNLLETCPRLPSLFRFTNPLLRRVIYHNIPRDERTRLHSHIFKALSNKPLERHTLLSATHSDRASMTFEAFSCAERLGDCFSVAGDPRVGEYWYFRGLEAAQRIYRDGASIPVKSLNRFLLKTIETTIRSKHLSQASKLLLQVQAQTPEHQLIASLLNAQTQLAQGDTSAAAHSLANSQIPPLPASPILLKLYITKAQIFLASGHPRDALHNLFIGLEMIRHHFNDAIPPAFLHLKWDTLSLYSHVSFVSGDPIIAETILASCLQRTLETRDALGAMTVLNTFGQVLLSQRRAQELCEVISQIQRLPLRITQITSLTRWLARAHRALGNEELAQSHFRDALELSRSMGWTTFIAETHHELQQVHSH